MHASSPKLYVGLMTGTSADGVDAALIDTSVEPPILIDTHFHPYPTKLKAQIINTTNSSNVELDEYYLLDRKIAKQLSVACCDLLRKAKTSSDKIVAIGSHGQTIRHRPNPPHCYTAQLGDPNIITAGTGIDVVCDFRRADMAIGGQGAPFAPIFHDTVFRQRDKNNIVLNLGGIANITILAHNQETIGFDTGPANSLMDLWIQRVRGKPYDINGQWASSGKVDQSLLNRMLQDPYFAIHPPKSTGREYFGLNWLDSIPDLNQMDSNTVQATLCELTATSVANAIKQNCSSTDHIFICGGGHRNHELVRRIEQHFPNIPALSTEKIGLNPDFLEAVIFAWLAHQHIKRLPGNMPRVTGSSHTTLCGGLYRTSKKLR